MPRTSKATEGGRADFLPVIAVLITGIVLAVCVALAVRGYYLSLGRQQFQRNTSYYSSAFKNLVERHVTSLAAIHAFVSASHDVTRWEFSAFAHQILPQNSGFKAVIWLPQTDQAGRKAFEARLQNDGLYGLHLRELTASGDLVDAGDRPAYLPVAYVEPFEGNGSLIGVDLSSNPIYAPVFEAALHTGQAAVSPPLSRALVEGARQPMVLVAFPLNRQTRAKVRGDADGPEGYALGILQLDRVIQEAIGPAAPIQAVIAYGSPTAPKVFLPGQREQTTDLSHWYGDAAFHQTVPFTVAGRHFFLVLRSGPHDDALTRIYAPAGAALLILALTALLAQSILATILRKRSVERAVIERTAELRDLNTLLSAEVQQRRLAEAALRIAKDKAESANRAKSAFLSTMSHELRTPLNAIIGFSSMLIEGPRLSEARSADYLQEINGSGVRLLDLINDILEITQMDTDNASQGDPICLGDIIDAVVEKMQPLADEAGLELKTAIAGPLPLFHGDGRRLQKALQKLLSNAIKFTDRGGWAQIAARASADELVLEVSDNGVGMPPGAETKIIDIFAQCDSSLTRRHDGAGLGLTFVSRVASQHGGKLHIASNLGQGTVVSLSFPLHRAAAIREVA
jgi:signal transduction histidine kinase